MGFFDRLPFGKKNAIESQKKIGAAFLNPTSKIQTDLNEQFKGKILLPKFPSELGEEHLFDYNTAEQLYRQNSFVMGVIDKFVDYIVGPGFYVTSDDERAETIIRQFMQDLNFDTLLRGWIKEALIKGNGYLEIVGASKKAPIALKILDAKTMYVKRDEKGEILYYNQYFGSLGRFINKEVIKFSPNEIAHLALNVVGNDAYGIGVICPNLKTLANLIKAEKDMHVLTERKANSPYVIYLGDRTKDVMPSSTDITDFGTKLEYLENQHEWVVDDYTRIEALDFGKLGEKFIAVLDHDTQMLFYGFQVPAVLMGQQGVPEGLAKEQAAAFERRIQSIQAEVEKVIEQKIFRRIMEANGLNAHVEFEWGQPSEEEKNKKIMTITTILGNPVLNPLLRAELEKELARLFDISEDVIDNFEEERKKESERQQPIVPGQNRQEKPKDIYNKATIIEDSKIISFPKHSCEVLTTLIPSLEDFSLQEWLGFNYQEYLAFILSKINDDEFEQLAAQDTLDLKAGKLGTDKIFKLKEIFKDSFKKGESINTISQKIEKKVKLKNLLKIENGAIALGENGEPIVLAYAEMRPLQIARSETTRLSAEGSLNYFKENNIKEVKWVASLGDRTCPICEALDGQIYDVENAELPPAHTNCRCTIIPIITG